MIEISFDHDDNSQIKFSWLLVVASKLRELALLPANIFWNTIPVRPTISYCFKETARSAEGFSS